MPKIALYKVELISFDPKNKIKMIKEIRETMFVDLKDAVNIINNLPCIVAVGLSDEDAKYINERMALLSGITETIIDNESTCQNDFRTKRAEFVMDHQIELKEKGALSCPACGSSDVTGVGIWGKFGKGNNKKIWRCNKCGNKF